MQSWFADNSSGSVIEMQEGAWIGILNSFECMIYIPTFEIHMTHIRLKVMYQFFLPAIEIYIIHIGQKLMDKFCYAQMVGESLKQCIVGI
jgi:hypothetical protein